MERTELRSIENIALLIRPTQFHLSSHEDPLLAHEDQHEAREERAAQVVVNSKASRMVNNAEDAQNGEATQNVEAWRRKASAVAQNGVQTRSSQRVVHYRRRGGI